MTTALEGGEGSASSPGRFLPQGQNRYPLYRRLGKPQSRSGQVRKISPSTGIRSPDCPSRSQSLYRLSYPAHCVDIPMHNFLSAIAHWGVIVLCLVFVVAAVLLRLSPHSRANRTRTFRRNVLYVYSMALTVGT